MLSDFLVYETEKSQILIYIYYQKNKSKCNFYRVQIELYHQTSLKTILIFGIRVCLT